MSSVFQNLVYIIRGKLINHGKILNCYGKRMTSVYITLCQIRGYTIYCGGVLKWILQISPIENQISTYGDILSYVASLLNPLKIYRNQVCVKEIQI